MSFGLGRMALGLGGGKSPYTQRVENGDNEAALFSTDPATSFTRTSAAVSSDQAHSGTQSAKITSLAVGSASHYVIIFGVNGVAADEALTIAVWVYVPSSWTGAGVKFTDTNDGSWSTPTITTKDEWVLIEAAREPKGAPWTIGLGQNVAENVDGLSFYVDDLSILTA